jgi:transcriptional regulator with XRE-family HTH domain
MRQTDFGKRIIEIRKSKGLTQEELSEKCHVTVRTIRRIESGSVVPRSYTIRLLSEALDKDLLDIAPNGQEMRWNSRLKWFNSLTRQVRELFNLKTNTMKKVSVLAIILIAIGFGLFILIPNGHSQKSDSIDYA